MNPISPTTIETIAGILMLVLLIVCILLWLRRWKMGPVGAIRETSTVVQPWSRSWLDFLIVFWVCIIVYVAITLVIIRFIFPSGFDPAVEAMGGHQISWYTILYSSGIQLAILVTVLGAKSSFRFRFFENGSPQSPALTAMDRLIRYMPLLWVTAALSVFLTEKLGISSGEQEAVTMLQQIDDPLKFLAMAFLAVVAAPILEELFFRGILLRFLVGTASQNVALLINAVLFAMLHFNSDSTLPIAVLGFLLGKVYLDTGDLRTSIWMHTFFNAQSVVVIAIARWIH